jgi:hypothetical protein
MTFTKSEASRKGRKRSFASEKQRIHRLQPIEKSKFDTIITHQQSHHFNTSTHQHTNTITTTSTRQHIKHINTSNTSTHQTHQHIKQINTSNTSTHQTHQHIKQINTSQHQHNVSNTSTHQHINTSTQSPTHQHINTPSSIPQRLEREQRIQRLCTLKKRGNLSRKPAIRSQRIPYFQHILRHHFQIFIHPTLFYTTFTRLIS